MSLSLFLRTYLVEAVLLAVANAALAFVISTGFYAWDGTTATTLYVLLGTASLSVVLFLMVRNAGSLRVGAGILAACALVSLIVVVSCGNGENPFNDEEGNIFLLSVISIIVSGLGFSLERTRSGLFIYTLLGLLTLALMEFLYEQFFLVAFLAFLVSTVMLLICQGFRLAQRNSATEDPSFGATAIQAGCAALLAAGIACGIYAGVIAPLNPPAQEIKLFFEYRALEELPRRGTNAELAVTNPELTSVITSDIEDAAQQDPDEELTQEANEQDGTETGDNGTSENYGIASGFDIAGLEDTLQIITHAWSPVGLILLVLALFLLLALPPLVKYLLRRHYYRRSCAAPPREHIDRLYRRIVRDLGKLGMPQGKGDTPYEYARFHANELVLFSENEQGIGFIRLTEILMKARFSDEPISDDELAACDAFYRAFFKNCRTLLGGKRYALNYYRL